MDQRPENCRFRLQDEHKPYPRSSCAACGRMITTGLGNVCQAANLTWTPSQYSEQDAARRREIFDALAVLDRLYAEARKPYMDELAKIEARTPPGRPMFLRTMTNMDQ